MSALGFAQLEVSDADGQRESVQHVAGFFLVVTGLCVS